MNIQLKDKPPLRFPEFSKEWKTFLLSEISIINPSTSLPENFIYLDLGSVEKGQIVKFEKTNQKEAPSRAQRLLSNNDILFQAVRPYQQNNLLFKEIRFNKKCVASTGYIQIRCREASFLYQLLLTPRILRQVLDKCTGSNYPAISSSDLNTIHLKTPSLPEQQKIADFLTLVDRKIELQRRKVDLLKDVKRGLLQQMFEKYAFQNKSSLKIGEIFSERTERYTDGDKELLSVTMDRGIIKRSEIEAKDNSSSDKSNYKIVYSGDIVYNSMRMWQGASGVSLFEGVVSPAYTVIYPCANCSAEWAGYLFKTNMAISLFRRFSQGLTSDTWNLKYEQLKDIYISFPDEEEQRRSASCMSHLEKRIQKEEALLASSLKFKKGLLQQMFV